MNLVSTTIKTTHIMTKSGIILLIAFFCLIMASCKKDSDQPKASALSGNTLGGTIYAWTRGNGKTVLALTGANQILKSVPIQADGSFSILLGAPVTSSSPVLSDYFGPPLVISDTSAKIAFVTLYVCDSSGNAIGMLERKNLLQDYTNGFARVSYCYISKKTTLTGTSTFTDNATTYNYIFDLDLIAGWNTFASEVTSISASATSKKINYITSNTESPTVSWIFTPN